jgi:hypothetical protein
VQRTGASRTRTTVGNVEGLRRGRIECATPRTSIDPRNALESAHPYGGGLPAMTVTQRPQAAARADQRAVKSPKSIATNTGPTPAAPSAPRAVTRRWVGKIMPPNPRYAAA